MRIIDEVFFIRAFELAVFPEGNEPTLLSRVVK